MKSQSLDPPPCKQKGITLETKAGPMKQSRNKIDCNIFWISHHVMRRLCC